MGENGFATLPVAIYGVDLLMCAVAFTLLTKILIGQDGPDSTLARAYRKDFKGKISVAIYCVAAPLAFVNRWIALALYVVVAIIWFLPDPRIENTLDR